jgi:uncharacterized membrane protein HdeD (DUF308 family)
MEKRVKSFRFRWKLFLAGILAIVVGYALLAAAGITTAPILLVVGYCILIPLSFL